MRNAFTFLQLYISIRIYTWKMAYELQLQLVLNTGNLYFKTSTYATNVQFFHANIHFTCAYNDRYTVILVHY